MCFARQQYPPTENVVDAEEDEEEEEDEKM